MTSLVALPTAPMPVPRDGRDRPLIVPKAGGKPVAHTRTTTFIDCVEDKSNLATWGKTSVLEGLFMQPTLLDEVAKARAEEDPKKRRAWLIRIAEKAMDAAGANDKREKGTSHHNLTEYIDAGLPLPDGVSEADALDMAEYMLATMDFDFEHVEKLVVVNSLCVAGTPDRVARYTGPGPKVGGEVIWFENELLITDLKTGTIDYGALKMAAQLGTYAKGEFYDPSKFPLPELTEKQITGDAEKDHKKRIELFKKMSFNEVEAAEAYSPIGEVNQEWGVIFNLRPGSQECTLHWADLTLGWELAELALVIRKARSRRGALQPFNFSSPVTETVE